MSAFALFLDPAGKLARYSQTGGKTTLELTLSEGMAPSDPELADFVRLAFADYVIALSLELPVAPGSAKGFAVNGRTAAFSMKAADLYTSRTPVVVSLTY